MKGEYLEQPNKNQTRHNTNTNNMFSKLHHPHPHQHPQQIQQQIHHQQLHPFANHFQTQQVNSDEAEETQGPPPQPSDGATIEVVRRPRGRPPGSKNKPKPPVIITRETEPPMSPYILEVAAGSDVVEAIARFCRRKSIGLCVLAASGSVSNVTLRQPSSTPGATVTFHGRFDILSITATFLPTASPPLPTSFTISLAGPQGQIVGGLLAGALLASGTVYVVAASFNTPSYHRLPPSADDDGRDTADGSSPAGSAADSDGTGRAGSVAAPEIAMYGCHVAPSEVIWSPAARQPPPPPPPGY